MTDNQHKPNYGYKVSIRREGDLAHVDVHAPMYMNKKFTLPHCYTNDFTDYQILKDHSFHTAMAKRFPS